MSYEPQLIILRDDLESVESELIYDDPVDDYIRSTLKNPPIKLRILPNMTVNLITCRPELTSFNKKVRDRFYDLNVEFTQDL